MVSVPAESMVYSLHVAGSAGTRSWYSATPIFSGNAVACVSSCSWEGNGKLYQSITDRILEIWRIIKLIRCVINILQCLQFIDYAREASSFCFFSYGNIQKNNQLFHQQKGIFSYAEPGFPEELTQWGISTVTFMAELRKVHSPSPQTFMLVSV